jgi:signal transduction histidine kinase
VVRSPRRSNYFALAFFLLLALVISLTWLQPVLRDLPAQGSTIAVAIFVLLIPYVLLRLAGEFSSVHSKVQRVSEVGLAVAITLAIYPGTDYLPALIFLLVYFVSVATYASRRFAVAATAANGISRMRFQALSLASVLLGIALFSVTITTVTTGFINDAVAVIRQMLLMGSALLYFAGFSPPVMLRRAWLEPELRRFLHLTRNIPRHPDTKEILTELERISAETVGAPHATIGLYNEETGLIDFKFASLEPGQTIGGRAFAENRPILSLDAVSDDPENREIYEYGDARAVMAAPINTEDGTIGVIALHAPNPPIFVEDDLSLLMLLADQIGVLLENRSHIRSQAELAAREESTRLKDEFLSLAAHDLKTPLTTILATGQYLERRISSRDDASTELRSISRLNREAVRLRKLVEGLLDASRIEQGQLIANTEPTDLSALVSDIASRAGSYGTHHIETEVPDGIYAECDALRIQQVTENLLENARKYSPAGSIIHLRLSSDGDQVHLAVSDQGIGIDDEDQERVFDRYFRTEDAEYRTAQGIGLGLFICKEIIDQHGGTISVDSEPGKGSTFRFSIPVSSVKSDHDDARVPLASEPQVQEH